MKLPGEEEKKKKKSKKIKMDSWVTYIVECSDGSLYCGATNNIEERIVTHNTGKGSKYTRSRLPVTLLLTSKVLSKRDALRLERAVKKQKANEKVDYLRKFSDENLCHM